MASLLARLMGRPQSPRLTPGEEAVAGDEETVAAEMVALIRDISLRRSRADGGIVRRFNQAKSQGCFDARFEVGPLPPELAQGIFATPGSHPARVRFANASEDDDREKDLRGCSIIVQGLAGGDEQHFLFNSHPVLFAADPREFLGFIRATAKDQRNWFFFNPLDNHLGALGVLLRARDRPGSLFDIRYWSTTPSRLGDDATVAVKHALVPCSEYRSPEEPGDDPHYLAQRMNEHLAAAPACFDFMVQFQADPQRMPIEDASVVWQESESPLRKVARLVIEAQDWQSAEALAACERITFNPWTGLPAHRPLGGINRVRDRVYREIGEFRNAANAG